MKLVAYSIGAMVSFHGLIVAAVAIYIFGGIWMVGLASHFAKKKYGTALL